MDIEDIQLKQGDAYLSNPNLKRANTSIQFTEEQIIDVSDLRIVLPPKTKLALAISSSAQINRVNSAITFIED
jgi:hypothetical protein